MHTAPSVVFLLSETNNKP